MAEPDEAEQSAARLEAALERIERRQSAAQTGDATGIDPRITTKLDNLIRALRSALDS